MNKAATPKRIMTVVLIVTLVGGSTGLADNPIVQTIYTADPAPMVYDGVCYVYPTHDEDVIVRNFFTMNDWRCYSTTDMVNWTDLGSPLSYKDFSWARGDAWAGQCIHRNGKFYFYVPINQKNGGNAIGVAVSDRPAGPFKDALDKPLLRGFGYIDPAVFIDEDGQAYLYWGNPKLYYIKLNEDMISSSGQINEVPLTTESFGVRSKKDRATRYEEGPWLYKRKDLYYLVFAAGPISEHIAYATGPTATGPWTFRNTIMPTQGKSFTNHPGLVDYKGKTYFFYHNGALPDGGGFHRSVCVEQFELNKDGTIPTFNMTKEGPQPVGTLNPYQRTEAETITWESGVKTAKSNDVGIYVTDISDGDYIKVREVDFGDKAVSKYLASVAGLADGGEIELRLDGLSGELIGTLKVKPTGASDKWETQSCTVNRIKGVHDLYLKFTGGNGQLLNFDWWKFE